MKLIVTVLLCFFISGIVGSPKKRQADYPCGKPKIQPFAPLATDAGDRIVGGQQSIPHSWPWQVRLYNCDENVKNCDNHFCGGSLVGPKTVISAAHCVGFSKLSVNRIRVRLGSYDLRETTNEEQTIAVSSYTAGADWNEDIVVLTLEHEVTYNDHVSPVCLASKEVPIGATCYVTGFGQTDNSGHSEILLQTPLAVINPDSCSNLFDDVKFKPERIVCAEWNKGSSSCFGDSGGPFVCLVNDVWELQGAVCYGSNKCGSVPSVYSKITANMEFIKAHM